MDFDSFEKKAREGIALTDAARVSRRLKVMQSLCATYTFNLPAIVKSIKQKDDAKWMTDLFACVKSPKCTLPAFKAAYAAAQSDNARAQEEREQKLNYVIRSSAAKYKAEQQAFVESSAVRGTSTALDKRMVRSADIPMPSEVRTPETLARALELFTAELFGHVVTPRPDPTPDVPDPPYDPRYMVFQGRLYAIRFDYRVQNLLGREYTCANRVSIIGAILGGDVREATRCWAPYFELAVVHDARNVESFALLYVLFLIRHSFADVAKRYQLWRLMDQLYALAHGVHADRAPKEVEAFSPSNALRYQIGSVYVEVSRRRYTNSMLDVAETFILDAFCVSYGSQHAEKGALATCVSLLKSQIQLLQRTEQDRNLQALNNSGHS